jgi:hypothetical protein
MENLKGRSLFEDKGVDGKIILKLIMEWERVDWIHLAQDMIQWLSHVNTVMNFLVP